MSFDISNDVVGYHLLTIHTPNDRDVTSTITIILSNIKIISSDYYSFAVILLKSPLLCPRIVYIYVDSIV